MHGVGLHGFPLIPNPRGWSAQAKGGLLWVWPDASPSAKADSDAAGGVGSGF
jgi:hypothetical protein